MSVGNPFEIPAQLTAFIENRLEQLGTNLSNEKFLAQQIQTLSDFYIDNPKGETPDFSKNKAAEIASLVYYFPLNFLRNLKVFKEANRIKFLNDIENVIEFGSGLGPSSWALKSISDLNNINSFLWIEKNSSAKNYAENFTRLFPQNNFSLSQNYNEKTVSTWSKENSLAVFSYSLTELKELPQWSKDFEAIAIIEPSTQEDGRKLQELRSQLIQMGYSIWAPCLHEMDCPLLKHSKKDWCHDRLLFNRPSWLEKIENHLPWKNNSLTFSYLLARKKTPPWKKSQQENTARVIGDTLYEKGKTRQLICKNDERLFLSWLSKNSSAPQIPRGSVIQWSEHEQKSNEVRPSGEITIFT